MEDVDRTFSGPELEEAVADGVGGSHRRDTGGRDELLAAGKQRCERRRVRAAGPVGRANVMEEHWDLDVLLAVEEVVDGVLPVPAGDEHHRRTELVQALGQRAPVLDVEARERLGLGKVRGHDGCERKQLRDERLHGVVLEQLGARARDHHRIDD